MTRLLGDTRKTPRANYDQGSIMLIRMVNFMHYSDITIRPLPGFNVLLGHNGSGKSAIVNAICIGLGGSIDTLQVPETATRDWYWCEVSIGRLVLGWQGWLVTFLEITYPQMRLLVWLIW